MSTQQERDAEIVDKGEHWQAGSYGYKEIGGSVSVIRVVRIDEDFVWTQNGKDPVVPTSWARMAEFSPCPVPPAEATDWHPKRATDTVVAERKRIVEALRGAAERFWHDVPGVSTLGRAGHFGKTGEALLDVADRIEGEAP